MSFTDARRGCAHATFRRDGFTCRYCGRDGSRWPDWLTLSWDHLLPQGHPQRDNPAFIVTACGFCHWARNRTVGDAEGKSPEALVAPKRPIVLKVRETSRAFWEREVKPPAELSQEDAR